MEKLNYEAVVDVVGHIAEERIAAIIASGATAAEVMEAMAWLSTDDQMGAELRKNLGGRVAAVYDILRQEEPVADEEA